jgi:hypothetical protein
MTEQLMKATAKREMLFKRARLTISEAAFVLGVSVLTLRTWMRQGLVDDKAGLIQHDRRVRFVTAKLQRWMRNGRVLKVSVASIEMQKIAERTAA